MTGASATIQGRLTADPELRYTQNGTPVANFTVAHTPRRKNATTGEWEDAGDALFLRTTVWRDQATNVAASLHKGDSVVVLGRLSSRSYEHEGVRRTSVEFEADTVSVDLRRQTASVTRLTAGAAGDGAEPWSQAEPTPITRKSSAA